MNKFRLLTEEEKGPQRIPKSFLAVVNIGYIFFPSEKLSKFVKNESNNENWDTIDDYIAKIKE
jgi:hypothetical protein